jgi:hypothetical protein
VFLQMLTLIVQQSQAIVQLIKKLDPEHRKGPGGGVICGISVKVNDEWVTK